GVGADTAVDTSTGSHDRGARAATAPVLRVRDLTARHRDGSRGAKVTVRAPDLVLHAGELLAVVGRSGSGKTTLARCLAGLHRDHDGDILLDGTPLPRSLRDRGRGQLAAVQYVFQDARAAFDEHRPVVRQVARTAVRLRGVDDQPPSALDPARPLLCVPLMTRRAPLGVLTLSPPDDERWDADDAFMLIELARRAGVALENARRFEHNRDIAETLQRALLTELPTTPGLRLAARYLPATRGLNIGGDWYDAFRQPDGGLIAVIGDVTGHGLRAAVMMSQLRTALRAYAVDGKTPGQLLTRLHLFLHHLQPDLYATAVIARFHPQEPTLTWAAAGHPPPVLRSPDGRVRILDAKPGAMLGIPLHQEIADHTVPLPPGSTLALYTDGLVERRAQGIDPGIEQLASALEALPPATLDDDLQESADQLLHPLLDDEHEDDVCLLLCHVHSDAGHIMARPG
ncbi:PP2C family protein-serine/threonine phosphatase, partial [Streptomyces europaeiscabiei]|uniref:PP2C family protein-serine/threonine phosphatase n=1 Tax=Streptomyces europaeiscabiei TaxID=146819 RepID=UPI001F08FBB9